MEYEQNKIEQTNPASLYSACMSCEYADDPVFCSSRGKCHTGNEAAPRLVDRADLLSELEEEELEARLDEISERQQADVVVVTVNSLDGKSAQDYADDFYDYNGYGIGTDKSGILLLVSMEARDWHITTTDSGSERSRMLVLITYRISSCLI